MALAEAVIHNEVAQEETEEWVEVILVLGLQHILLISLIVIIPSCRWSR